MSEPVIDVSKHLYKNTIVMFSRLVDQSFVVFSRSQIVARMNIVSKNIAEHDVHLSLGLCCFIDSNAI